MKTIDPDAPLEPMLTADGRLILPFEIPRRFDEGGQYGAWTATERRNRITQADVRELFREQIERSIPEPHRHRIFWLYAERKSLRLYGWLYCGTDPKRQVNKPEAATLLRWLRESESGETAADKKKKEMGG